MKNLILTLKITLIIIIFGLCLVLSSCGTLRTMPSNIVVVATKSIIYDTDTVTRCKAFNMVFDSIVFMGYIPKGDTVLLKKVRTMNKLEYKVAYSVTKK